MNAARIFPWLLRVPLAGVLLYAAWSKLDDAHLFAAQMAQYRLLPPVGNQLGAVTLPWIEGVAGLCLLLGLWPRAAALVAAGLMGLFMLAAGSALARGLDISCGCFGTGAFDKIGPATLVLQLVLMALAVGIARTESRRETLRATPA